LRPAPEDIAFAENVIADWHRAHRPLTAGEEARLTQVIRDALGWPFRLKFVYFEREIPRSAGGKFEEFVSAVES